MTMDLTTLIERWDSGDGKPYKGSLIDYYAYHNDPTNIGCMCAQGQVLHLVGGISADELMLMKQSKADAETAKLLNISRAHAVLLRHINDSVDGAPSIVLTAPERVLGDRAQTVLAFWKHLDTLNTEGWQKVAAAATRAATRAAARAAARAAVWGAAGNAALNAARAAARDAAGAAARDAAWDAAWGAAGDAAGVAAWDAALDVAWDAAGVAAWAASEIQGAAVMRERGQPFFFLPLFGFADPESIPALPADYGIGGEA
jgi:hypothetical protein